MLDPSTIACLVSSCIAFAVFIARRTVLAFRAMAAMSSTTLAVCGWWAWLLRDGMGPDSIETHGAEALARFLEGFWIPALLWTLILGTGMIILKASTRRRATRTGALGP